MVQTERPRITRMSVGMTRLRRATPKAFARRPACQARLECRMMKPR